LTPAQEFREVRDWLAQHKHDPFLWIAILMPLMFVMFTFGGNVIFPPSDAKRAIAKVLPSDADIRFIKNNVFFCQSSRGKYLFGYDFWMRTDEGVEYGRICRDIVNGGWVLAFDNPKFKYLESR
jgi:hypothetical protein